MSAWALMHAVKTPARAFAVTGKQTKNLWLIILGLATLFGFSAAVGFIDPLSIFTIASVIASGIYLADVRPAVKGIGKGGEPGPLRSLVNQPANRPMNRPRTAGESTG